MLLLLQQELPHPLQEQELLPLQEQVLLLLQELLPLLLVSSKIFIWLLLVVVLLENFKNTENKSFFTYQF